MGRLSMRTRVSAATMRVSSLPPRDRKWWFGMLGLSGAVYATGMWMLFAYGKPGQFGHPWGSVVIGVAMGIFILNYMWMAFRKESLSWTVRAGTARLDDRYEELCEKWWNER